MNTLNELLIANKQWDLLYQIINTHIYNKDVNHVFEILRTYEHQINELLSGDEIDIEAIIDVVSNFFTTLNQITPETGNSCYKEAQEIKGHVFLMFLDKGPQICTLICEQFPDEVNKKDITVVNDENTLLAEAISASESNLMRLLTKNHLKEKETLQSCNEELKRKCEALERQLNIQQNSQQTRDEEMIYTPPQRLNMMFFSEPRRQPFFQNEDILASGSKKRKAGTDEDSLYEEYNEINEPSPKHTKMTGLLEQDLDISDTTSGFKKM